MEERNNINTTKHFLSNIKSNYILKKVSTHINELRLLKIIQKNKTIQNLLNKDIDDYKKYSTIEIEILPLIKEYYNKEIVNILGKFINIYDEKNIQIYFNDSNEIIKKNKIEYKEKVNKIKIVINNNIISLVELFRDCNIIEKMTFNKFRIRDINNMNKMFDMCTELIEINFNSFYTENVTNMQGMFFGCQNLIKLNLSNFNTINVKDMAHMFYRCYSLNELIISNIITKKVTNMSNMFKGCRSLVKLDLTNFDTHNVTDMSYMFSLCSALEELNISSFDTKKVINMKGMFKGCEKIKFLDISNFIINDNTDTSEMFYECPLLNKLILPSHLKSRKKTAKEINKIFYCCNDLKSKNVLYNGSDSTKNCICF